MEEGKKDNKRAGIKRALSVKDILSKKYEVFPFDCLLYTSDAADD